MPSALWDGLAHRHIYIQILMALSEILFFIRSCIFESYPTKPLRVHAWALVHWELEGRSFSHAYPRHQALPTYLLYSNTAVRFPRKLHSGTGQPSKQKHFDHFIRVWCIVFPWVEVETGNTDIWLLQALSLHYPLEGQELCVLASWRCTRLAELLPAS